MVVVLFWGVFCSSAYAVAAIVMMAIVVRVMVRCVLFMVGV